MKMEKVNATGVDWWWFVSLAGWRAGRGRRDGSETFLCALARNVNDGPVRCLLPTKGGSKVRCLDQAGLAWWVVWELDLTCLRAL